MVRVFVRSLVTLAKPPRIALIDIGLPGLDGYGVARAVREAREQVDILLGERKRLAEMGADLEEGKIMACAIYGRPLEIG